MTLQACCEDAAQLSFCVGLCVCVFASVCVSCVSCVSLCVVMQIYMCLLWCLGVYVRVMMHVCVGVGVYVYVCGRCGVQQVLSRNNSGSGLDRSVSAVINLPNRPSMSSLQAMKSLHALQPQHSVRLSRKLSSDFVNGLSTPKGVKEFDFAKKATPTAGAGQPLPQSSSAMYVHCVVVAVCECTDKPAHRDTET